MTFERTLDYALIRKIITDPALYDHVSDDGSPSREDFQPLQSEAIWYVLAWDKHELLGCFSFFPQNSVCYEVHTCLLPNSWGSRAHTAALQVREWMFAKSPAVRIVTNVPEDNRLALRFAKTAGMQQYGVNPKSYLKHGHLMDQFLLGVSKCP